MMTIYKELKVLSEKYRVLNVPNYHNEARKVINDKYGKGWREELVLNESKITKQ